MIKLDTNNILNWNKIIKLHKKYISKNITSKLINSCKDTSSTDFQYYKILVEIVTGEVLVAFDSESEELLIDAINGLCVGKRAIWLNIKERYESRILCDEYKIIDYILTSKGNKFFKNLFNDIDKKINISSTILLNNIRDIVSVNCGLSGDDKLSEENKGIIVKCIEEYLEDVFKKYNNSKRVIEICKQIFNYDDFCNGINWNRNELLYLTNIQVCPYCNRQYITKFNDIKDNKYRTTADLDHYYIKSKYPLFALSLYNFIPSCQVCNRTLKGAIEDELIYPYEESFDDYDIKFYTDFSEDIDLEYILGDSANFKLLLSEYELEEGVKSRINNSKAILQLEKVYESHKGYVSEIIKRYKYYNKSWINEIYNTYNKKLNITKEEILLLEWGYSNDINFYINKPLSKLTKDIVDELGGFEDIFTESEEVYEE